jgi:hypothetical protein
MNPESLSHLEELLERYPQRGAQRDIAIEEFTTDMAWLGPSRSIAVDRIRIPEVSY